MSYSIPFLLIRLNPEAELGDLHNPWRRDAGFTALEEALRFGSQAHVLTPKAFRPCTPLSAVNFELGNYELGRDVRQGGRMGRQ